MEKQSNQLSLPQQEEHDARTEQNFITKLRSHYMTYEWETKRKVTKDQYLHYVYNSPVERLQRKKLQRNDDSETLKCEDVKYSMVLTVYVF